MSIFRRLSVSLTTFTAVTLGLIVVLPPSHAFAISGQNLIALTNNERAANGLPSLTWNAELSASASAKARHMCANGYWAHTAPDGTTPWTFMNQAHYSYVAAGENLAKDFTDDNTTVAAWMASPGHRANILKTAFSDIGIATITCMFQGSETNLVVAHYGSTGAVSKPAATPKPQPVATVKTKTVTPAPQPVPTPVTTQTGAVQQATTNTTPKFGPVLWQTTWDTLLKQLRFNRLLA